ncbi:MAG: DoxX family protein [Alphaproteobacteria bacterium]|nr:DoxX family protein [Alphaproteobacteria bacterium]
MSKKNYKNKPSNTNKNSPKAVQEKKSYCDCLLRLASCKIWCLDVLAPAVLILARLQMANIFFTSGMLKVKDWSNTLLLFEAEHPVPFLPKGLADMLSITNNHLPANVAACMGTFTELVMPVLLVLGLGGRLAAFLMLVMTAVIQFSYQESMEHVYWALLLGIILTQGPGKWSFDYLIRKRFYCPPQCCKKDKAKA